MVIKEIQTKNIMTKSNLPTGGFSLNPYTGCTHACKYCYASFMKRFTNHSEPWGEFVDVKTWEKIKNPQNFNGKRGFLCSVTDPYQPIEAKHKRTRQLLEELKGSGIQLTISTKSDLILRDLDIIKTFPNVKVSWSINTLDEDFKKDMDRAVSVERRLNAMKTFYEAGINTTCFISPIFPGITDVKAIINECKDYCNMIWLENLNLRGDYKSKILNYIKEKYPRLYPLYDEIYNKHNRTYWENLSSEIKEFAKKEGLEYVRNDDTQIRPHNAPPIIINYFYHEEIVPSAQKKVQQMTMLAENLSM